MNKSTINYKGVDYLVRTIDVRSIPTFDGDFYADVDVAGEELWDAIDAAIEAGDYDAAKLDDTIFYYVDDELLHRDASDEEIVDYIRGNVA